MSIKGKSEKDIKCSTTGDTELGIPPCGLFGGGGVAGINFVLLSLGERMQM